jgi:flagellar biosynthesis/type III secretory pathway M-ring protein FliF/YscJ
MGTENKTDNQDRADNQNFKKYFSIDNLLKIVIGLSIFILAFTIFYRYVFYLPHKEALQKQEEENRKQALEECLSDAEKAYPQCWESFCEAEKKACTKYPNLYDNCSEILKTGKCEFLPKEWAKECEKEEENYKNECFKKFK